MLPKKNRLKKEKDFQKVFRKGKSFKEDFLVLKFAKNDLSVNRFGFIVSKKVSKKAVRRNQIKRNLREVVRENINDYIQGLDVIFITLPNLKSANFQKIRKVVLKLFKKSKILKK